MVGARCAPGGPKAVRDANKVGGASAAGWGYFALGAVQWVESRPGSRGASAARGGYFALDGAVPKAVLELATAAATREALDHDYDGTL